MIDVNAYLMTPYEDGARSGPSLDCWGLALAVRRDMGLPELPEVGVFTRLTPIGMQVGHAEVTSIMEVGEPRPGALAAVFKGKAFAHVGVVILIDGRMAVLETNPGSGARWMRLERFKSAYYRVVFYRDKNLPEQA